MKPNTKLNVVDLCSGTGSSTHPFVEAGHSVTHIDLYPPKNAPPKTIVADIRDIAKQPEKWFTKPIDHCHSGTPCDGFSVASIGRMWTRHDGTFTPKHPTSTLGVDILKANLSIISWLRNKAVNEGRPFTWTLENPRAMMRKIMPTYAPAWVGKPVEVSYCRYGGIGPVKVVDGPEWVWPQKPTDIWTNLPNNIWRPLKCNARPPKADRILIEREGYPLLFVIRDGEPCHEAASRGTRCGVQRIKGASDRGMMPTALVKDIYNAVLKVHDI